MKSGSLTVAACALSATAIAAIVAGVPSLARAGAGTAPAVAAATPSRVVTLITGERVTLTRVDAQHDTAVLMPPPGTATTTAPEGFQSTVTPSGEFVVPQEALAHLGRQLDLSLFNVSAPPTALTVRWAPGATPHAIPGLSIADAQGATASASAPVSSSASVSSSATVSSGQALGTALRSGPDPLAGVASITAGSNPATRMLPQYTMANVVVTGLDRAGNLVNGGSVLLANMDDTARYHNLTSFYQGSASFTVPEGNYRLVAVINTQSATKTGEGTDSIVVLPDVAVNSSQTEIVADARTATAAVRVPTTPLPSKLSQISVNMALGASAGNQITVTQGYYGTPNPMFVTPVDHVNVGNLYFYAYYRLVSTQNDSSGRPYLYDVEEPSNGSIPPTFPDHVDPAGLAEVDAVYQTDIDAQVVGAYRGSYQSWEPFTVRPATLTSTPLRRTEYVTARPDISWAAGMVYEPTTLNGIAQGPRMTLRPGQRLRDVFGRPTLVPGFDGTATAASPCGACQRGNELQLNLQPWTDGRHAITGLFSSSTLTVAADARLYADGTLADETSTPATKTLNLPAGTTQASLVLETTKYGTWTTLSRHVTTDWSWPVNPPGSAAPPAVTCADGSAGCAPLPLLFADYNLGTDLTNAIGARTDHPIDIRIHPQPFATLDPAHDLTLTVSTDDGTTWSAVPTQAHGSGGFTAIIPAGVLAAGAGQYLSIQIHTSNATGDALDQTIIRATRIAP